MSLTDDAILLIMYFYELPSSDILETAKRYGLDPNGPAVDLVCDTFTHVLRLRRPYCRPIGHLYHQQVCLEAINLLESRRENK